MRQCINSLTHKLVTRHAIIMKTKVCEGEIIEIDAMSIVERMVMALLPSTKKYLPIDNPFAPPCQSGSYGLVPRQS